MFIVSTIMHITCVRVEQPDNDWVKSCDYILIYDILCSKSNEKNINPVALPERVYYYISGIKKRLEMY